MKIEDCKKYVKYLISAKSVREEQQKEIAEYIAPNRGLFDTDTNTGTKRNPHMINNAGERALVKSSAGFTGAMTPQTQQWLQIEYAYPSLKEKLHARTYADNLEQILIKTLLSGSFYPAIHEFNEDLLAFACAMLMSEFHQGKMVYRHIPVGSFALSLDENKLPHSVVRIVKFTPKQMLARFGKEVLSTHVKQMLENNPYEEVKVYHFVTKREEYDIDKLDNKSMPYASYWYEENGDNYLLESGYTTMPFVFTAWSDSKDMYGTGLGDKCLDDQKQIDALESRKIVGLDKFIDPPLKTTANYKSQFDTFAGGVNVFSATDIDAVRPLYDINHFPSAMPHIRQEIQTLEMRLDTNMYASTFADISMENRPTNMSATEYTARRRDRIMLIEPSLAAYEPRVLIPLLERTILTLERNGMLPLPPENLGEQIALEVKFTSPMSEVLKEQKAQNTKLFVQEILALSQIDPSVKDKIDLDQTVDEIADASQIFATVVRSDEQVQEIRQQRQEQERQLQEAQMAMQLMQTQQGQQGQ